MEGFVREGRDWGADFSVRRAGTGSSLVKSKELPAQEEMGNFECEEK